jgi:hypothetical protein
VGENVGCLLGFAVGAKVGIGVAMVGAKVGFGVLSAPFRMLPIDLWLPSE